MAPLARLERTTSRLGGGRSIRLSYWGVWEMGFGTDRLWRKGGRFAVPLRRRMRDPLSRGDTTALF